LAGRREVVHHRPVEPVVRAPIVGIDDQAWIPIDFPNASWDD